MPWYYWSVSMSRYTFGETSARGTDIEDDILSAAISNAGGEMLPPTQYQRRQKHEDDHT